MAVWQYELAVRTRGRELCEVTAEVSRCVRESGVAVGLCTVFVQHTSASLIIQENADPAVLRDLTRWMAKVAPEGSEWEHDAEGPDDMPAHARAAITKSSESMPVRDGRLLLGTWQGLYLWEHRAQSHQRRLVVHISGDASA
jgi:secondary thiamine-phosphate synthase enzyme